MPQVFASSTRGLVNRGFDSGFLCDTLGPLPQVGIDYGFPALYGACMPFYCENPRFPPRNSTAGPGQTVSLSGRLDAWVRLDDLGLIFTNL